jgi:translation elongation factor P/translation initiation factor 5A
METLQEISSLEDRTYLTYSQPGNFSEELTRVGPTEGAGDIVKIQVIHRKTGKSQEKVLTPAIAVRGGVLIGRNPKCDIVLNSPEVSRVHGRIVHTGGQYHFTDLGSTSGSQVNNQKTQTNQQIPLKPDDIIQIGKFVLLVEEFQLNRQTPPPRRQTPQPLEVPVADSAPLLPEQMRFKVEELKGQGIPMQGTTEFMFQGRWLVEVISLSKRLDQKAMNLWQAELDAGRFCILVEYPTHLTVWGEKH